MFDHLLAELNQRTLAYLHLGIFDDSLTFDYLDGRASDYLRARYDGHLVGSATTAQRPRSRPSGGPLRPRRHRSPPSSPTRTTSPR